MFPGNGWLLTHKRKLKKGTSSTRTSNTAKALTEPFEQPHISPNCKEISSWKKNACLKINSSEKVPGVVLLELANSQNFFPFNFLKSLY